MSLPRGAHVLALGLVGVGYLWVAQTTGFLHTPGALLPDVASARANRRLPVSSSWSR